MSALASIAPFDFATAGRIRFGRGCFAEAAALIMGFGRRVLLVRGNSVSQVDDLARALRASGCTVVEHHASGEPDIVAVSKAVATGRHLKAEVVVSVGGGAVIDLGKAAAALVPGSSDIMEHLEGVGGGRPLEADPVPFVAIPTTAGTGAEVTKNAVIMVPEAKSKVSLRDDRMLPDLALVDPALSDNAPRAVTLGSGLDALVQVIEPFLNVRSSPLTTAICRTAIPMAVAALHQLEQGEHTEARDAMAFVSLSGGLALANAGLGAVHGLAGVVGGRFGAPHGIVCGRLLGPVLGANSAALGPHSLIEEVAHWLADGFDMEKDTVFASLPDLLDTWGLDRLAKWIPSEADLDQTAEDAAKSSSMRGNPCVLSSDALVNCLRRAL